jgi:hypothetical protein
MRRIQIAAYASTSNVSPLRVSVPPCTAWNDVDRLSGVPLATGVGVGVGVGA